MIIYVGDSKRVKSRITGDHCSGNVEGSALRRTVAKCMGYEIHMTQRSSGRKRCRIKGDSKSGETRVSEYMRSGEWQYMLCKDPEEAKDFQFFLIERLDPPLNKERKPWKTQRTARYEKLLAHLLGSPRKSCFEMKSMTQNSLGVYILHHEYLPDQAGV